MADVISAGRKSAELAQNLAKSSAKVLRKLEVVENNRQKMAGTTGLEPEKNGTD